MRQNDVYRWHWKEGVTHVWNMSCKSHIAVYFNGGLRDTYWHDFYASEALDTSKIDLTLLGNIDDCDKINRWQIAYYDPSDVIDMAHSNNGGTEVWLKRGAVKSQSVMLEYAEEKERQAYADKDRAERAITEWEDKILRIKAGDLDVYL